MLHLHSVILFLFNNHNFIQDIWSGDNLEKHLKGKFDGFVERHGDIAGVVSFIATLDAEALKKIEDYIKEKHPSHYYTDEEKTQFDKACENAGNLLSNDAGEIPNIIRKLIDAEDKNQTLDFSMEEIDVWEKVEYSFTVKSFLEEIGIV